MENLFRTAILKQLTGFSNADEEHVGKLEVGGVTTQLVPACGGVERNRGATGRRSESRLFWYWNWTCPTPNAVAANIRTFIGEEQCPHGHGGQGRYRRRTLCIVVGLGPRWHTRSLSSLDVTYKRPHSESACLPRCLSLPMLISEPFDLIHFEGALQVGLVGRA